MSKYSILIIVLVVLNIGGVAFNTYSDKIFSCVRVTEPRRIDPVGPSTITVTLNRHKYFDINLDAHTVEGYGSTKSCLLALEKAHQINLARECNKFDEHTCK